MLVSMSKLSRIIIIFVLGGIVCSAQEVEYNMAAEDYLNVYQKFLSSLNNTRCSMYPSCSNYAKMVFQDYSFPIAMVLTADRLTRCSHDLDVYLTTYKFGFPAAIDFPTSRSIPEGIIVNYTNPPVFVSNQTKKDSTTISADFIVFLINHKNYQGALYEIDKLLFEKNHRVNRDLFSYKLKCFEGLNLYKEGVLAFEESFPHEAQNDYSTLFNVAHLYDLIGDDKSSVGYYEKAASSFSSSMSYAHPFGELGKLYVKQKRYDDARLAFKSKLTVDNNLDAYNTSIGIISDIESFKMKNKGTAMALSIIPGCGYFYTNQPKSAITALILNGVLGYASYTSFKSKNYGVGAILSVLSLSFYIGNIVGSGNSAVRYNESAERKAINQLQSINPFIN